MEGALRNDLQYWQLLKLYAFLYLYLISAVRIVFFILKRIELNIRNLELNQIVFAILKSHLISKYLLYSLNSFVAPYLWFVLSTSCCILPVLGGPQWPNIKTLTTVSHC